MTRAPAKARRERIGIPRGAQKLRAAADNLILLWQTGHNDNEIARQYKCSQKEIWHIRNLLDIAPSRKHAHGRATLIRQDVDPVSARARLTEALRANDGATSIREISDNLCVWPETIRGALRTLVKIATGRAPKWRALEYEKTVALARRHAETIERMFKARAYDREIAAAIGEPLSTTRYFRAVILGLKSRRGKRKGTKVGNTPRVIEMRRKALAMREMRFQYKEIARALRTSRQRIHQIVKMDVKPRERARQLIAETC